MVETLSECSVLNVLSFDMLRFCIPTTQVKLGYHLSIRGPDILTRGHLVLTTSHLKGKGEKIIYAK